MQNTVALTPPCPVGGDILIFCQNVEEVASEITLERLHEAASDESEYVVFDNGDDTMTFVVKSSVPETRHFMLKTPKPGFDSTFIWTVACDEDPEGAYLLCLQLPVSGRKPIPKNLHQYFLMPDWVAYLDSASFWIYNMTERLTLARWREERGTPEPDEIYEIASRIEAALSTFHAEKHCLMRFNAETIVLDDDVMFLGVMSMDMPWNESCAKANGALEYDVFVPPEYRGYSRNPLTVAGDVYVFGIVLYYSIANANPPICEALDFECPLGPRAFEPMFPFGWDNIIQRAILPSPMRRYATVEDLFQALTCGFNCMCDRMECETPLVYECSVDTYIGITKRLRCPVNQDAVLMRRSEDGSRILIVVADGVSTSKYGSGDLASALLVSAAANVWEDYLSTQSIIDPPAAIRDIFKRCNESICEFIRSNYAQCNPTASDSMGTTALVGVVEDGVFTLGAIGDSRCYLIRREAVTCVTRDHNLFTMAIVNGMPVQQCAMHPHAGSLVQCLGYFEDINKSGSDNLQFDTYSFKLMPGDHVLLTTDGLLDYAAQDIRDAEAIISRTVLSVPDPALACLELILVANRGGGGDNTGIGLIYVDKMPDKMANG